MDEILAVILQDTYSLTQFKHRLRTLKSNLIETFFGETHLASTSGEESSFGTGPTPEVNLAPQDLDWLKSLPSGFYQNFTKDNVYQVFTNLEGEIPKLKILIMYLSFEPDDVTLNQIGQASRKAFASPLLLLDIKLNPILIAGPALSWKGVLRDYSLKAKLTERKEEILQSFKKFLR